MVRAVLKVGEFEFVVGGRRARASQPWNKGGTVQFGASVVAWRDRDELPTVRDFTQPPAQRLAQAIASAAIVRDVAALGALVLFGTMLALVLTSGNSMI
ncbi:hypothetical protein [Oryzibacter oryziterrae]|uniref:hypothetical protein n=1 Tax=Oryzibacter oryziterrae TaxID=2766474 RepID=UPI001F256D26|nr:hypothetical protein [Oryzibacter oryziterrae]